jgi:spore photoproduct lyase
LPITTNFHPGCLLFMYMQTTTAPTLPFSEIVVDNQAGKRSKLWMPKRVLFTPEALEQPFGQQIHQRVQHLNLPITVLKSNRLTGLQGANERETYKLAKSTLAVVNAPASQITNLQPIPPSADWQFHLAKGCPAHCQYCYLAGSLSGAPVIRTYANLPHILEGTQPYQQPGQLTTFEASCYTDPLSIEHLTGSLSHAITFFGQQPDAHLRFVTKFDNVEPLLALNHNGHTRARLSLNAEPTSRRMEGGTSTVAERIAALRKLALPRVAGGGAYPIGVVLAPIMPIDNWQEHYSKLFDQLQAQLNFTCDLTFELITHRFTPGSKEVLLDWYPNTGLDMNEETRSVKRNKFGGLKYVYTPEIMKQLRSFLEGEIAHRFPQAKVLYWT